MDFESYIDNLSAKECREVILKMMESSGYHSQLKGASVEYEFEKLLVTLCWLFEKIKDQNLKKRYDFNVLNNRDLYRVEVKTLDKRNGCSIKFGDPRDVMLPSGRIWRTYDRQITEDFDFLAMSPINLNKPINDFIFVPFDKLKRLVVKDIKANPEKHREKFVFTDDEREWVYENFMDSNVRLKKISTQLTYKDLE